MERVTINPMTAEQAATLKRLAEAAYDLAAFKPSSRMTRRMSVSRYWPPSSNCSTAAAYTEGKDWVVVDWFDLTHWQAILAAIVAISTPIVAILGWSKPLLRWFGSLFERKARSN
jgi:hypothetical protein